MQIPKICPNCNGSRTLLYFDAIYYYVACEQCGMTGARALSEEEALSLWNERGDTAFTYEVVQDSDKLVRILQCDTQRVSKRYPINLPIVLTLSRPNGKKITGVMRNVSFYGAFLQLKGGNMSAIPASTEELAEQRMFVYYKNPVVKQLNEKGEFVAPVESNPIQQIELIPKHMLQTSQVVGVGGCFKSPNAEQLKSVQGLVEFARGQ
ncbi:Lar family restriction alleviation protein [Halodesulfovibrio marinisediminis]|uniref:Restriction alleviation protein Lar/PilZ domain n=1 Tax=Halodesulfovibrio marinisediminis DSM 17456 TaxID=1121457 RepID=A0A1N6J3B3_9BACT|nr:Lar family restriction alleviation protein [Halodesulfovibrio marinisediminis]SIO38731.1 Restriction alleviation protein Lar/PilZ domain [Halodesulfovibrio marinisediminis DSM 17456]